MKKITAIHKLRPEETIMDKIFYLRNLRVILDKDVALLYGISKRTLIRKIIKNSENFPKDFVFQMTPVEFSYLKLQLGSYKNKIDRFEFPFVFTEQGIAILASVLNKDNAIKITIKILYTFKKIREKQEIQNGIFQKLEELENKCVKQDDKMMLIFEYIKQFEETKQQELEYNNRKCLGFRNIKKE